MNAAIIRRIRKDLSQTVDDIYASFSGEHNLVDVVDPLEKELRLMPEIMPSARDIAYMVAQAEDQKRCSMPNPKQLDAFTREWASIAEIRLGDGNRVTYANATVQQLHRKQLEQSRQIAQDVAAMQFTGELIVIMDENPDAKTLTEAMHTSGRWTQSEITAPRNPSQPGA